MMKTPETCILHISTMARGVRNTIVSEEFCMHFAFVTIPALIRAVEEQRSSPELSRASEIKMHSKPKKKKKKKNSKLLEYEDVLYFDLQPHPMACTLRSVVMAWKQPLQDSYI